MQKAKLSIIIPVYNAGPFIEECLRSVMEQTMNEIEIIVVNDGSTDDSLYIIQQLAGQDERIKVYNSGNRGVSAARNHGIENANGAYIGFVDADDRVEPEMFEKMCLQIEKENGELVICNVNTIDSEGEVEKRLRLSDAVLNCSDSKAAVCSDMMRFKYDYANWNKLYSNEVIKKNRLRFNEGMTIWEDLLFNLMYLNFTNKIVLMSEPWYQYRVHSKSLYRSCPDLIPQFNLLYKNYLDFTAAAGDEVQAETFKKEMARLAYNQLLSSIGKDLEKAKPGFFQFYGRLKKTIGRLNPGIFYYTRSELQGVQGIKKWLLYKRFYGAFSILVTAKKFLLR